MRIRHYVWIVLFLLLNSYFPSRGGDGSIVLASIFLGLEFLLFIAEASNDLKSQERLIADLKKNGFNADYTFDGNIKIAIDTEKKQISFIYTDQYVLYSLSNIDSWQILYDHDNNFNRNKNIKIQFKINDIDAPNINVYFSSLNKAENIFDKITLLLRNSGKLPLYKKVVKIKNTDEIRKPRKPRKSRKTKIILVMISIIAIFILKTNLKEGEYKDYYMTGNFMYVNAKLKSTTNYYFGIKDGLFTKFDNKGLKIEETNYKYGLRHGLSQTWSSKGYKTSECTYYFGREDGLCIGWSEDRIKTYEHRSNRGTLNGEQKQWYSKTGRLFYHEIFRDGELIKKIL